MNRILCVLLTSVISMNVNASPPILERELNPELAAKLGFSILTTAEEGDVITIEFIGPEKVKNDCYPGRSGSQLLDSNGDELMLQTTPLNKNIGKPEVIGFFTGTTNTMGVFIDYFCPEGRRRESVRYWVPSVRQWLITNQSSRPATPSAD